MIKPILFTTLLMAALTFIGIQQGSHSDAKHGLVYSNNGKDLNGLVPFYIDKKIGVVQCYLKKETASKNNLIYLIHFNNENKQLVNQLKIGKMYRLRVLQTGYSGNIHSGIYLSGL